MNKMNYYAVPQPWRMPKWVGMLLGGVFATIAIGSMVVIVQLTRPPAPPVTALAAAPALQATPTTAPAVAPAEKPEMAPVAAAETTAPATTHAKHHAASHHRAMKVASAKHATMQTQTQRNTMLAKHDTKEKRHEKDALDKLLGL